VSRIIAEVGADPGIAVINLSFGAATTDGTAPLVLRRAISRISPDTVIVAAAGNNGRGTEFPNLPPDAPMWPAAFDEVVAVGAHDDEGLPAAFSPDVPWVDLMAPGTDVVSTFLPGQVTSTEGGEETVIDFGRGYARWRGTSFAAAEVTGEIVALMNARGITARQALALLLERPDSLAGATIGAPISGNWFVA
jgi:subtilisin family serine protease